MSWLGWIQARWSQLEAGVKVVAPAYLDHPSAAGFRAVAIATPNGQRADWSLSLNDGSRIHVQEYPGGSLVVHRDRHDPDQGIVSTIDHLLTETWVGPVVLGFVVAGLLAALMSSSSR